MTHMCVVTGVGSLIVPDSSTYPLYRPYAFWYIKYLYLSVEAGQAGNVSSPRCMFTGF